MLRYRLITGPLLFALLAGAMALDANLPALQCTCCPQGLLLTLISTCYAALCGIEMTKLLESAQARHTLSPIAGGIGAGAMTLATWFVIGGEAAGLDVSPGVLAVVPMGAVLLAMLVTATSRGCTPALGHVAAAALSTVWVGGGMGILMGIYALAGWQMLLLIVAVTKLADIGAYTVGSAIGRHKLIPWISPGKTWEGLAGGIVFAVAGTLIFFEFFNIENSMLHDGLTGCLLVEVGFGVLLAIGGLVGDLSVSMFKRDAGVKDSGVLLPGMGGLLDVMDSLLVTGALTWILMQMLL